MSESTTCCGFGGTFSVKFGDISTRMADKKCAHITRTGAAAVVAGDLGCLLNIEGRLRRNGDMQTRVLHIAFADDPAAIESVTRLSGRTYELTDFLVNVVKIKNIPGHYSGTLTYHDSCAGLRELGVQAQPRALLAKMPGVTITEMNESTTCCGFGGTFSVKFGDISTRMADKKCAHITQTGAAAVVAGDLGCLLNIEGRLRRNGDTANPRAAYRRGPGR